MRGAAPKRRQDKQDERGRYPAYHAAAGDPQYPVALCRFFVELAADLELLILFPRKLSERLSELAERLCCIALKPV